VERVFRVNEISGREIGTSGAGGKAAAAGRVSRAAVPPWGTTIRSGRIPLTFRVSFGNVMRLKDHNYGLK
jgi:hypothetical protein